MTNLKTFADHINEGVSTNPYSGDEHEMELLARDAVGNELLSIPQKFGYTERHARAVSNAIERVQAYADQWGVDPVVLRQEIEKAA